jgi:uncharacterized protein (TIGR00255 family)
MAKSMTGYGRGESLLEGKKINIEIRSTNHRFCDVSLKLPRRFSPLEADIKKLITSRASRGKIDMSMQFENSEEETYNFAINLPLAKALCKLLETLQQELNLSGKIDLSTLLLFRDIIAPEKDSPNTPSDWDGLEPAIEQALASLQQMQELEGAEITADMRGRLGSIRQWIEHIESIFPQSLAEREQALRERISKWCAGVDLDAGRMAQEIAYIADKSDITEEITRAKSHIKQFDQWLDTPEAVGRKLDFLLQEINREVNTIGSKASAAQISLQVVQIKNELEKIREQVQNIL